MSQAVEEHVVFMDKVLGPEAITHVLQRTNQAPKNKSAFVDDVVHLVIGPLTIKTDGIINNGLPSIKNTSNDVVTVFGVSDASVTTVNGNRKQFQRDN